MNNELRKNKINKFTDLIVWKESHDLVVMVYLQTKLFPKEETYALVDQMRRAASSITANIAEGFGRHSYKEKVQFYYMSKGSLLELMNFFYISKDVGYLNDRDFERLYSLSVAIEQLLSKFISKSKTFINQKS